MLNVTIGLLHISNVIHSPFISVPLLSNVLYIKNYGTKACRFGNNFYYSSSCYINSINSGSFFYKFLGAPVKINMDAQSIENTHFQQNGYEEHKDAQISFVKCTFYLCTSASKGGAIQIIGGSMVDSILNVNKCIFTECRAEIHGGAIYAIVSRYSIHDSCFLNCSSKNIQSCSLKGISGKRQSLNFTAIVACGRGEEDSINLIVQSSFCVIHNMNISYNSVSTESSGLYMKTSMLAFLQFNSFIGNSGSNVVYFHVEKDSSFDYINFINNSALDSVIMTDSRIYLGHSIFSHNSNPILFAIDNNNISIIGCVFDVPEDVNPFRGMIIMYSCRFNILLPRTFQFSPFRYNLCGNEININSSRKSRIWIYLFMLGLIIILLFKFKLKKKRKPKLDDTIPFL